MMRHPEYCQSMSIAKNDHKIEEHQQEQSLLINRNYSINVLFIIYSTFLQGSPLKHKEIWTELSRLVLTFPLISSIRTGWMKRHFSYVLHLFRIRPLSLRKKTSIQLKPLKITLQMLKFKKPPNNHNKFQQSKIRGHNLINKR